MREDCSKEFWAEAQPKLQKLSTALGNPAGSDIIKAIDKAIEVVRCPNHRDGGATSCPRGGAALQIWQRKQWGDY